MRRGEREGRGKGRGGKRRGEGRWKGRGGEMEREGEGRGGVRKTLLGTDYDGNITGQITINAIDHSFFSRKIKVAATKAQYHVTPQLVSCIKSHHTTPDSQYGCGISICERGKGDLPVRKQNRLD